MWLKAVGIYKVMLYAVLTEWGREGFCTKKFSQCWWNLFLGNSTGTCRSVGTVTGDTWNVQSEFSSASGQSDRESDSAVGDLGYCNNAEWILNGHRNILTKVWCWFKEGKIKRNIWTLF